MDVTRTILIGVLAVSFLVGASFIHQAFTERTSRGTDTSMIRKASKAILFRLRLAAGAGLLLWVITGVVWLFVNWK